MSSVVFLTIILATAVFSCGQTSDEAAYQIRAKGTQLSVRYKGKTHLLNTGGQIDAEKVTEAEILFAARKDNFRYLVVDVFGQSRAVQNDRQCGAGTEANLLWIKLDANWKIADIKSVRYESCWSSIEMGDGIKISGRLLQLEFENFREDISVKLIYHADEPEKGFQIIETKLKDISKLC